MDALKIIPQVFFDFIGRIVPGVLAIGFAVILFDDSWKDYFAKCMSSFSRGPSDSISTFLLLVLCYIIGHLISPLTKGIQGLWKKDKKEGFDSKKYEWLRVHQTEAGGLCTKLRAEFTMYNSFAAVFLIFTLVEYGQGLLFHFGHFIVSLFLLIMAYLMQMRGKEGEGTFQNNVNNFYSAAHDPKITKEIN